MGKTRLDSGVVEINPICNREYPAQFYYIDLEAVTAGELTKDITVLKAEAPSRAQRLLRVNDILFQTVRPYQQNNYLFSRERELRTVASTGYAQIRTQNNPVYIYYSLHQDEFVREVNVKVTGSNYPAITPVQLGMCSIYFEPDRLKQNKIAVVLTSVDEAITASRALIKKYAAVKQGLMQDLLGKGEKVSLKKLGGRFIRGHGITRADIQSEGVPCIRYGELYTTYDTWLIDPISHIPEQLANRCLHINNGDLLFTLSGETAEEIGKTVAYLGKERVVVGGDLAVFTAHKQNPLYLAYILNAPDALKQKELLATGSMVVHINSKRLESISVPLPPLPEQERIVQILAAADERLTAERDHLKKLKAIKQGLMNDLLTNKVSTDQLQGGILDGEKQNEQ